MTSDHHLYRYCHYVLLTNTHFSSNHCIVEEAGVHAAARNGEEHCLVEQSL